MRRPEKKSESLEIRLPHSQKEAFMAACRERGVTASDTLRQFIAADLEARARHTQQRTWTMTLRRNPRKTAAGLAGTALAAATLGTGAGIANDAVFDRFDRNGDGLVSYGEFMQQVRPQDAEVMREVIVEGGGGTGEALAILENNEQRIERRVIRRNGPDAAKAPPAPEAPGDGARAVFEGLDRDGSGTLTREEFAGEGEIVRRSDDVIEINGETSRVIGLEVTAYDVTEAGSTSFSINRLTTTLDPDAPDGVVEQAFRDLDAEMRAMQRDMPAPPATPRRG